MCVYLYMYVESRVNGVYTIYTLNYYDIIDLDIHVFPVRKRI